MSDGRYVHAGKAEALKNHELKLLTSGVGFAMCRLGLPNTGDLAVRITFTSAPFAEQITLSGDIHPGPSSHGCVSNMGYGIDWFGGRKSTHYLCEKFLQTVWVPEYARDILTDKLTQLRGDDLASLDATERREQKRNIRILEDSIEAFGDDDEGDVCRSADAFSEFYSDSLKEEYEGEGFTYSIRDGSWLVAIQRRFAECYQAQLAAATPAPTAPLDATASA